jgi:signal recognition particle subunit SEC65
MVALRFPDPLRRQDRAGRVIPHEFVVLRPLADEINSVEDGLQRVWPRVADEFEEIWVLPEPPSADR